MKLSEDSNWWHRLVRRITVRIWNRHISIVLGRLYSSGTINSRQLHIIASQFDPTQTQHWLIKP